MKIKLFTDKGMVEEYESEVIPEAGSVIVFPHKGTTYYVTIGGGDKSTKHIIHSCRNIAVQMEIEITVKKVPHKVSIKETADIKEV